MTDTITPDWWAIAQAAQGLGINTRRLVALEDIDAALAWTLQMSREHHGVAALSYYELAVMLGHRDSEISAGAGLDWNELLRAVEKVAGAVKAKIAAEKAAAEKAAAKKAAAEQKAAAEKAEAEKEAAELERLENTYDETKAEEATSDAT